MIRHLRPSDETRTLCGRTPKWGRRIHKDWPLCKTCERIWRRDGGMCVATFDADGWMVAPPPRNSYSTSGSNLTVQWLDWKQPAA